METLENVVYIDTEKIKNDDLYENKLRFPSFNQTLFVTNNDTVLDDDIGVEFERIECYRNWDVFRNGLSDFNDKMFAQVNNIIGNGGLKYRNVDLFDVIKYEFLFAFEKSYHRLWVIEKLIKKWNPNKLFAFFMVSDQKDSDEIDLLKKSFNLNKIKIEIWDNEGYTPKSKWFSKYIEYRKLFYLIKTSLKKYDRNINQKLRKHYDVVFIEKNPNSAKIAKYLHKRLIKEGKKSFLLELGDSVFNKATYIEEKYNLDSIAGHLSIKNLVFFLYTYNKFLKTFRNIDFYLLPDTNAAKKYLRHSVANIIFPIFYNTIQYIESYRALMKRTTVKNIVTTNYSGLFSRAFCYQFPLVKSFYIQHGIIGHAKFLYHFPQDFIFVWSKKYEEYIKRTVNKPKQQIVVAGNPIYTMRIKAKDTDYVSTRNRETVKVLYLAARTGGTVVSKALAIYQLQIVLRGIALSNSIRLLIKLHPGDKTGLIEEFIKNRTDIKIVSNNYTSAYWIRQSDICIVSASTTGLEACFFEKPLLFLNLDGNAMWGIDYLKYNAAYSITSATDMREVIQDLLKNNCRNKFINGQKKILADYHQDFNINLLMNYLS